ncbi:MAG: SapC family protein [Rhodospirillales bacterium]|nr:SapC family protein [Rhodospirillales bacterium]
MFENLELLDSENQRDLRFSPASDFCFAAALASAPLSASEVIDASRAFPVVFAAEGPLLPMALLSLKEGENAFVDADGTWLAPYVPAHIRRYPFILGNTDTPDNFSVMFVPDAPHFNTDGDVSERLFTEDGEKGTTLTKAIEFLSSFQAEVVATEKLLEPLAETEVLTMQRIELSDSEGKSVSFDGVRAIDKEKLLELDDATLGGWVRSGLMVIIDAHLASLRNFSTLAQRQGVTPK